MAGEIVPPEPGQRPPASQPFHLVALLSELRSSLSDVLHCTRGPPPAQRDNYAPPDLDDLEEEIPQPLLRDSCTAAADQFLHRQWRLGAAQTFARAVTANLKQRRQADVTWRIRALNGAARAYWFEAAAQRCWPAHIAKLRWACEVPIPETAHASPDASPPLRAGSKRLRSPTTRSGREKRRRSNNNELVPVQVNTRTVTNDVSSLVFGQSVTDLPTVDHLWNADGDHFERRAASRDVDRYAQRYIYDLLQPYLNGVEPSGRPSEGCSSRKEGPLYHTDRPVVKRTRVCIKTRPPNDEDSAPIILPVKAVDGPRGNVWANKPNWILSKHPSLLEHMQDPSQIWPETTWCPNPPGGNPHVEIVEILCPKKGNDGLLQRRSAWTSKQVVCDTVYRVYETRNDNDESTVNGGEYRGPRKEVVVSKLPRPQTMDSIVALMSPHPISDIALMAAIALTSSSWPPELIAAWSVLCRYRRLQLTPNMKLNQALKDRIIASSKNNEELGVLEDIVSISPVTIQDYAAHVILKLGEPAEWISKVVYDLVRFARANGAWSEVSLNEPAAVVLPLEALYFIVRRNSREKRRGRAAVEARRSGFDLERALQPTDTPQSTAHTQPSAVSSRYAGLVSRLPLWASAFRKAVLAPHPRDLWDITLPMIGSFNQQGGALVTVSDRRADRADFVNRFLSAQQIAELVRPILFVRLTRLLPGAAGEGGSTTGAEGASLSARCARVAIGGGATPTTGANTTNSDAQALCADQLSLPTTVIIKATNRSGKTLELVWDPYEEYYLWKAVADQVRCRFRSSRIRHSVRVEAVDDDFLDQLHGEMLIYLTQWAQTPSSKGTSSPMRHLSASSVIHTLMTANWDLVSHRVNMCLTPFARSRSAEACKAKFISLLFEYMSGGLSLTVSEHFKDPNQIRHLRQSNGKLNTQEKVETSQTGAPLTVDKETFSTKVMGRISSPLCVLARDPFGNETEVIFPFETEPSMLSLDDCPAFVKNKIADTIPEMGFEWIRSTAENKRLLKLSDIRLGLYDVFEDDEAEEERLREQLDRNWEDEFDCLNDSGRRSEGTAVSANSETLHEGITAGTAVGKGLGPQTDLESTLTTRTGCSQEILQHLYSFLTATAEAAKSARPEEDDWFSVLEAQIARLQFGKGFAHFKTQGLLSLAALTALDSPSSPFPFKATELTTKEVDFLVQLVNRGTLLDQCGRLIRILSTLHNQVDKRKQGQSISHENFVMEKPLRLHIGHGQSCIPIVHAMREYINERGGEVGVAASNVHSHVQMKYHRLLLPIHETQSRYYGKALELAKAFRGLPCYITNGDKPTPLPGPLAPLLRLMAFSITGRLGFDMTEKRPVLYATGKSRVPYMGGLLNLKRPSLPTFTLQPVQRPPPTTPASRLGRQQSASLETPATPYIQRIPGESIQPQGQSPDGFIQGGSDVGRERIPQSYPQPTSQVKRVPPAAQYSPSPQQRGARPGQRPVSILTPPVVPVGGHYYGPPTQVTPTDRSQPAVLPHPWVKNDQYQRDYGARPPDPAAVAAQYAMPPNGNMYMHMSGHYPQGPQGAPSWPPQSPSGQPRGQTARYVPQPQWGPPGVYMGGPQQMGGKGGTYMPSSGFATAPGTYTSFAASPTTPMGDYYGRGAASPQGVGNAAQRMPPPVYQHVDASFTRVAGTHRPPPPQYYRPPEYPQPGSYYDARNPQPPWPPHRPSL